MHNILHAETLEEIRKIMKKMGRFKEGSMGGLCIRRAAGRQVYHFFNVNFFLVWSVYSSCTAQEVVDPAVRGCNIASVSKKKIVTSGF